jgi:hypothetical protein
MPILPEVSTMARQLFDPAFRRWATENDYNSFARLYGELDGEILCQIDDDAQMVDGTEVTVTLHLSDATATPQRWSRSYQYTIDSRAGDQLYGPMRTHTQDLLWHAMQGTDPAEALAFFARLSGPLYMAAEAIRSHIDAIVNGPARQANAAARTETAALSGINSGWLQQEMTRAAAASRRRYGLVQERGRIRAPRTPPTGLRCGNRVCTHFRNDRCIASLGLLRLDETGRCTLQREAAGTVTAPLSPAPIRRRRTMSLIGMQAWAQGQENPPEPPEPV